MYLFTWFDNEWGSEDFLIVRDCYDTKNGIVNFYEKAGGNTPISKKLLAKMFQPLSTEEAVEVFNSLKPKFTITAIYSINDEEYVAPDEDEPNDTD
jgi:hypothetical protein